MIGAQIHSKFTSEKKARSLEKEVYLGNTMKNTDWKHSSEIEHFPRMYKALVQTQHHTNTDIKNVPKKNNLLTLANFREWESGSIDTLPNIYL